jgi:transposase
LRASICRTAPSECSTAGRQRLGGVSRVGDERLRQLLVLEATAVIQYTKPGRPATLAWLLNLLSRKAPIVLSICAGRADNRF